MKKEVPCPSCGAPVVFQSAASVMAVCEYCSSTLVRHDLDLENIGKMAQLQAPTVLPYNYGRKGDIKGNPSPS